MSQPMLTQGGISTPRSSTIDLKRGEKIPSRSMMRKRLLVRKPSSQCRSQSGSERLAPSTRTSGLSLSLRCGRDAWRCRPRTA